MLKKTPNAQINMKEIDCDQLICKDRLHSTRKKKSISCALLCMCISDHIVSSHIKS